MSLTLAEKAFRQEMARARTRGMSIQTAASLEMKMIILEIDADDIIHTIHVMQSLYAVTCIHETASRTRSHVAVSYHCADNPCTDHCVYVACKMIEALVEPLRNRAAYMDRIKNLITTSLNRTEPIYIGACDPWIESELEIGDGPSCMPEPLTFTHRISLVCRYHSHQGPGLFSRAWRWEYTPARDFEIHDPDKPVGRHSKDEDTQTQPVLPGITRRVPLVAYNDKHVSSPLMMTTIWTEQLLHELLPQTTLTDELFKDSVEAARKKIAFATAPLVFDIAKAAKHNTIDEKTLAQQPVTYDMTILTCDIHLSPVMTPDSVIELDIIDKPQRLIGR